MGFDACWAVCSESAILKSESPRFSKSLHPEAGVGGLQNQYKKVECGQLFVCCNANILSKNVKTGFFCAVMHVQFFYSL